MSGAPPARDETARSGADAASLETATSAPSRREHPSDPAGLPVGEGLRAAPHERRSRVFLRSVAIALSAPCIFYGLVGAGSTVILWTLIEPDFLRIDFHLSVLAAAAPIAFLLWVGRVRRVPGRRVAAGLQAATTAGAAFPPSQRSRGARGAAYGWALALNVACIALALAVAAVRGRILGDASLTGVLALLVVAPALNVTVLLIERDG